jgi:hypothetical protein
VRKALSFAALCLLAALAWSSQPPARGATGSGQSMAVPAYFAPGPVWKQMDGANRVVKLAVMDPANGPGGSRDPRYARAVRAAESAGITVIGYVFTDFAHRPLAAVESNIDAYYRWYAVDGVFFDQASTDCADEPYYATLNRYVKSEGGVGRTILNPGSETNQCYVRAADILLTFEGSASAYLHSYSAAPWTVRYPASRFWQVIYAASGVSEAARVVALSQRRRAGFVYVTPAKLPNQYDGLPRGAYWADELEDIAAPAGGPWEASTERGKLPRRSSSAARTDQPGRAWAQSPP